MKPALLAAVLACLLPFPAFARNFDDVAGDWTGPMKMDSRNAGDVRSAGELRMHVRRDGEVAAEYENGCRFSGRLMHDMSPNLYDMDVRMKGCRYGPFNRPWDGRLALAGHGELRISLAGLTDPGRRLPESMDARGTLRR